MMLGGNALFPELIRLLSHQLTNLYGFSSGRFTDCCRNRYITFVKTAAFQFQQLRLKKMAEEHAAEQVCDVVQVDKKCIKINIFFRSLTGLSCLTARAVIFHI